MIKIKIINKIKKEASICLFNLVLFPIFCFPRIVAVFDLPVPSKSTLVLVVLHSYPTGIKLWGNQPSPRLSVTTAYHIPRIVAVLDQPVTSKTTQLNLAFTSIITFRVSPSNITYTYLLLSVLHPLFPQPTASL